MAEALVDEEEMRAFELLHPFWRSRRTPDPLTQRLIDAYRRESRTYRQPLLLKKRKSSLPKHSIRNHMTGRFS